jgi:pectate lyase
VRQWSNTSAQCQQFRFESAGSGYYRIVARHSGKAIDLWEWNTGDGADFKQWPIGSGYNQQFSVTTSGDYVSFVNRHSGKTLEIWEWSTADGGRLSQFSATGGANQQWKLAKVGSGSGGGSTTTTSSSSGGGGGSGGTSSSGVHGYATVNGSTTGGGSASAQTVTSLSALTSAVSGSSAAVVKVSGNFSCSSDVLVGSNKTVVGVGSGSGLTGCGLNLKGVSNVIIRNLKIAKVAASSGNGDAIHLDKGTHHVWIDHNDLSSDRSHDKDYYDGLIDLSHAVDYVTISWNYLHDHYKGSLVGHSDNNSSEDSGKFHVTYDHNYFSNINSRGPSLRFGTGHAYNNYYSNGSTAVHSRMNAQFLVQNNVFRNVTTPIQSNVDSDVDGYVNQSGNDFGSGTNKISRTGSFTSPPYSFALDATSSVISAVTSGAGTGKVG